MAPLPTVVVPAPLKETVVGEVEALLLNVSVPSNNCAAFGVKLTVMFVLAPGPKEIGRLGLDCN